MNQNEDWEAIKMYAAKVNAGGDIQHTAIRLIAHKMQSPQEKEALQALMVLEHCACHCDRRFHDEIGKFRFLNEMIKLVSPKYLGNRTPLKVKRKVLEIMYKWTHQLRYETKILEAYQMLKQQGVITEDPVYLDESVKASPPPRPKNAVFEDDEKAKLLQKLLQSKNPEDLQAANRLIKNMVKEDEKRIEKVSRRMTELETVKNNVKVLGEMLANYKSSNSRSEDLELMKELYQSCERLRPNLFRLASEMDEKEEGIADILKANDDLSRVMTQYKRIIEGCIDESALSAVNKPYTTKYKYNRLSLLDLGSPLAECNGKSLTSDLSLLDDQLLGFRITDTKPLETSNSERRVSFNKMDLKELDEIFSNTDAPSPSMPLPIHDAGLLGPNLTSSTTMLRPLQPIPTTIKPVEVEPPSITKAHRGFEVLDEIGQSLLKQSLPPTIEMGAEFPKVVDKIPLNQMGRKSNSNSNSKPCSPALKRASFDSEKNSTPSQSPVHEIISLNDVFVPFETIRASSAKPVTLYDKNDVTVVLHLTSNTPRDDVRVLVVTTLNKNCSKPIKNINFQAVVPKRMKVKLQPPSATSLPTYNPILPPSAVTQIMLFANPRNEKIHLKYKIAYTFDDQLVSEEGEIDDLPEAT
uniref:ADP-ribosylation factor-binding protein GGA1 n=1 Tax=Strigamia maritima TaxID=126957 RepID=T1JGU8_STRMM